MKNVTTSRATLWFVTSNGGCKSDSACFTFGSVQVENEKIFIQIVRVCEVCDCNGDRLSKTDLSCHICSMGLKSVLVVAISISIIFHFLF